MQSSDLQRRQAAPRRKGIIDVVLGVAGGLAIATVLFAVRLWAWLTRTPYYKD